MLLRPSRKVALPLSRRCFHNDHLQADISNSFISKASEFDQKRPIAVKDNICTVDFPTTCGSRILDGFKPPYDATVVRLLRESGKCSIIGKTNMDEFGMGSYSRSGYTGPVRQLTSDGKVYSAGGSSGGSALAVKSKLCWAALGTDTGGSVRLPAAWCGVVGFKPSYGMVSRWGVVDYANSLDTVGVLAETVEKCDDIFEIIAQHDPQDPTSLSPEIRERIAPNRGLTPALPVRVGIPVEYNIAELSLLVHERWLHALRTLQSQGIECVPISLPNTKSALSAYYILAPAEASSNLAKYDGVRYGRRSEGPDGQNGILFSKTRDEGFGDEVKRRILLGSYTLSSDAIDNYFVKAQKLRRLVQRDFERVFSTPHPLLDLVESGIESREKVDLILCPTVPTPPPQLNALQHQAPVESYINDVFTVPASLAGLPAISIPWHTSHGHSQPDEQVGLQIIGQFGNDSRVLAFAKWLQTVGKAVEPQLTAEKSPAEDMDRHEKIGVVGVEQTKEEHRVRAEHFTKGCRANQQGVGKLVRCVQSKELAGFEQFIKRVEVQQSTAHEAKQPQIRRYLYDGKDDKGSEVQTTMSKEPAELRHPTQSVDGGQKGAQETKQPAIRRVLYDLMDSSERKIQTTNAREATELTRAFLGVGREQESVQAAKQPPIRRCLYDRKDGRASETKTTNSTRRIDMALDVPLIDYSRSISLQQAGEDVIKNPQNLHTGYTTIARTPQIRAVRVPPKATSTVTYTAPSTASSTAPSQAGPMFRKIDTEGLLDLSAPPVRRLRTLKRRERAAEQKKVAEKKGLLEGIPSIVDAFRDFLEEKSQNKK